MWVPRVAPSITLVGGWDIGLVPLPPTSRRAFLAGVGAVGAAVLVSSCTSEAPAPMPLESDPTAPSDTQVASELRLIALYAAVVEVFPDLATFLTPIEDQHREHARALGSTESPTPEPVTVPATARQAVRLLISAEEQATRERQDGCATESGTERVRLLTLIAASEASHVPELARLSEGIS